MAGSRPLVAHVSLAVIVVLAGFAGPWATRGTTLVDPATATSDAPRSNAHAIERSNAHAAHANHAPAPSHRAGAEEPRCDEAPGGAPHKHGSPDCPWCAAGRWPI